MMHDELMNLLHGGVAVMTVVLTEYFVSSSRGPVTLVPSPTPFEA